MPDVLLDTAHDAIICSHQIAPDATSVEKLENGVLPEDNEEFNQYFGCIWKRKRIIDNKGEVNRNALRSYLADLFSMGQEITPVQNLLVDDVMDHCENIQGSDHGLTAVKIHNCVLDRLYKLVEYKK